jgi:hypothetical protein
MPENGTIERIVLSLIVDDASGTTEELTIGFELYTCPFNLDPSISSTLVASGTFSPSIPPLPTLPIILTVDQALNIPVTATTKLLLRLTEVSPFTNTIEAIISGGLLIG